MIIIIELSKSKLEYNKHNKLSEDGVAMDHRRLLCKGLDPVGTLRF